MEFSSSLPLDLLAPMDPATRGAAPPLTSRPGEASGGGAALPFELCLELLEPALPSGETLPLPGNPLPVAPDEDMAAELDVAEALALALPGLLPAPIVASPLVGSADTVAAEAVAVSLPTGAGLPAQTAEASAAAKLAPAVATQNFAAAQSSSASVATPSGAIEARDAAPAAASAAPANAWLAALTDSTGETVSDTPPEPPQTAAAPRGAGDARATATTASTVAPSAGYAAEAAAIASRGEPSIGSRRSEEPSRGMPRIAWRDALGANTLQPSSPPLAAADTPDVVSPQTAPAATPFVTAMRGDVAAASSPSTAPVVEAGAAPGGHSTLHVATTQHASTTAQTTAAAATPDRAPVDTTTPRWQEAFASRVQWLADQNIGEAHIRLNPPELGAVDVKISLVEDRTFVQLTTHTTAARDELAQSLPRLRELFAASGLDLGGASVATGRDGHARNDGGPTDPPYASRQAFASDGDEVAATAAPSRRSAAGASRIDLFA